jgi:flagellar motility protein MotE (MotC chaperone)
MSEKKLTKEEAQALYDDMQRAMQSMMEKKLAKSADTIKAGHDKTPKAAQKPTNAGNKVVAKAAYQHGAGVLTPASKSGAVAPADPKRGFFTGRNTGKTIGGQGLALGLMAFLCCAKITLSAIEYSGVARVEEAKAVVTKAPVGPQWTKEQSKILTSLDGRRVELEERSNRLDKREGEFVAKERELAIRLTELKDLTEKLKIEREKGDKQRGAQLDQLANVYGSMNPPEAAHLLEQLDIHVALSLVERMPEKRMAQILALMNSQRALELTNLLSNR